MTVGDNPNTAIIEAKRLDAMGRVEEVRAELAWQDGMPKTSQLSMFRAAALHTVARYRRNRLAL